MEILCAKVHKAFTLLVDAVLAMIQEAAVCAKSGSEPTRLS